MPRDDVNEMGTAVGVGDDMLDAAPFASFYGAEHRHVVRIVYALCGSWTTAEDVTQEAFLKALRRWPQLQQMDRPDAWVRRVACNLATSRFRRRSIEARAVLRWRARQEASGPQPLPSDLERFWQRVRQLPDRQARAVALFYADDLPVAEVAQVMGCAEGTVKAHLHAARQQLRGMYDQQEEKW